MMAINKSLLLLCYLLLGAAVLLIGVDPSEEKSIVFHTDFDSTDSRLVLYYNGSATVERLFTINSDDMIKAFIDKEEMNIRLDGLSQWIDPNSFLATVIQPEEEEQKVEVVGVSVAGGNQKVNMSEKPKEKSHYLMFKEKSYSKVSDDSELKKGMKDKLVAEQRAVQKKIASYEKMLKQIEESKFEAGQFEEKLKLVDSLVEMIDKNLVSLDDLKEKLQAIGKSPSQPSMYFEFSSKVPEFIKLNPKPFTLKIKYIIKSETFYWSPQYLLSVDSKSQTGQLMFMANVVQKTGENFTNALVELSTDSLGQAPGLPQLDVLTLDQTGIYRHLRDTNTVHSFTKRMMGSASYIGSMPNNQQRNYQNAFNDGNTESVQADQNSQVTTDVIKSSTSFIIADRTSFITDSSEGYKSVSMLIAKINLESKWYHKVIPKQSSKVYTIMAIKNKSKYQLIPGDVNVFINNVLSTQSRIRSDVFPDDVFQIDIGIDRMVSVKINDKNKNEEESGWFSKTNTIIESSQITIENKKDVPINITVIDALPYTENWHVDDKLQIILTQPKNDQGKDIDLHEIFIPKPTADGKETIYQTEYQFNTKVGKKDMKCKIKKRNHSLERNFNISSKESIVLPLTYQMCVSK